jgi:hypothetical protein
MTGWDRNTPWRQGYLIGPEVLAQLGIDPDTISDDTIAIVASHDCDLAQDARNEPFVELVIGRALQAPLNGNYTHCKNLRCLHIELTRGDTALRVELETARRIHIPKESPKVPMQGLAAHQPAVTHLMSGKEKSIFQRWLAARYRRASFPDEFDRRLKDITGVAERLAKCFKDSGQHIPAVFFDVDQGAEVPRDGEQDLYELSITLLYATNVDPEAAEQAAIEAAEKIRSIFANRCQTDEKPAPRWKWIELLDVEVISDEALSYAQSQNLTHWHADHISLRTDPEQPLLD